MFYGLQSNSIGRSVMAVLKRDPRRLSHLMRELHGRQLPGSLRSYVWLDVLMKSDRDRLKDRFDRAFTDLFKPKMQFYFLFSAFISFFVFSCFKSVLLILTLCVLETVL